MSFAVENGGYTDLLFTVDDPCGNPLVMGTNIMISSSAGSLVGNINVDLPDTKSQGYTTFWVRLSDDDAEDTDPPEGCSINVEVTSRNGNAALVVFGTID